MSFIWKASEGSDQENLRWSLLRAMEWNVWPAFLSGPIAPLLLLFIPWWNIIVIVGVSTVAWSFVRYKYVNVLWADIGGLWGRLSWISVPVSVVLLIMRGHYVLAFVALIWPGSSAFFGLLVGGQTGRIQEMFMAKLGYKTNNDKIINRANIIDSQKMRIASDHRTHDYNIDEEKVVEEERCDDPAIVMFVNNFKEAVINKDRKRVALTIHYPIKAMFKDRGVIINNKEEFFALYDEVFDNDLCGKIRNADTHHLMIEDRQNVMLGEEGEVWFGKDGNDVKVTAVGVCRRYDPKKIK